MAVAVPLIAALAGGLAGWGVGGGILGVIVGSIVAFGVNYIGSKIFAKKSTADDSSDRTQTVRQAITAHRIVYGRAKLSGPVVFMHSNSAANSHYSSVVFGGSSGAFYTTSIKQYEMLYLVVVLAAHKVTAISDIQLDGTAISDSKFSGYAYAEAFLGDPDQEACQFLIDETDGQWTAEHRLRGRAYVAVALRYDADVFSNGIPNVTAIVDGKAVYDPRSGATSYSDNAALVVADYLMSDYGLKAGQDALWIDDLIAAANICDEPVALKSGDTEPRYSIDGTIDLDSTPAEVLDQLPSAMAGSVCFVGGKWLITAGAYRAPHPDALTESDLAGALTVSANRARRDLFNSVRATYIRPDGDWQATDAPVLYDEDAISKDGGTTYYQDIDFPYTTSGTMVQRLMKIALLRNRAQRVVNATFNLAALKYRPEDTVTFGTKRLANDEYRLTGFSLDLSKGVDLTIEQTNEAIFAWDPETDEQDLGYAASATIPNRLQSGAPAISIQIATDPVPTSANVVAGDYGDAVTFEAQARPAGGSAGYSGPAAQTDPTIAMSGITLPADFRLRSSTTGTSSAWVEALAPSAPGAINQVGIDGGVTVSTDLGVTRAQFFVGALGSAFADSAYVITVEGGGGAGTISGPNNEQRDVWARTLDDVGNISAPFGPVTVTFGVQGSGEGGGS